jgi:hypothetical protein
LPHSYATRCSCPRAGQRASAAFAARNWQRDGGNARELYARFAELLAFHEMREALIEARGLDLGVELDHELESAVDDLAQRVNG